MKNNTINQTNIQLNGLSKIYTGKVREIYAYDDRLAMIATDRISAFDHILPRAIPHKGAVLNGVAAYFLQATQDIVPNWLEAIPHPNIAIGKKCTPIKLEMVVRGYLVGHAWRTYKSGGRTLCGVKMPSGMKENQKFPEAIITPATKAEEGHDEDISAADILAQEIVTKSQWDALCHYSLALFERGSQMAAERGLILVDTKYEFGLYNDQIILIDEIHTPDSSRYFIKDTYEDLLSKNKAQKQLSKEFVREWLMDNGFQGLEGQSMPEMDDAFVDLVSARYIELYEKITGETFDKTPAVSTEESLKAYFNIS